MTVYITNITLPQNNHTLNFISNRLIRPQFIAMIAAIKHGCSCYMTPIEEQGIMGQDYYLNLDLMTKKKEVKSSELLQHLY